MEGRDIDLILALREQLNPAAQVLRADLEVSVEQPEQVAGRRVLIVEDGPTLTHGGMSHGAGWVAAQKYGAAEIVDPRASAVGSILDTLTRYPHLEPVLPAMGYSETQREELKRTIENSGAELVVNGSPADIAGLLQLSLPVVRVRYRFVPGEGVDLLGAVSAMLRR